VALRRDAARNRAVLLRAAAEVFRTHGADAPLDLVAQKAHLGRGTLYRHFPDRGALLTTLLEDRFEILHRYTSEYEGEDLLEQLLVEICGLLADVPGLMAAVRGQPSAREKLAEVSERTIGLVATALERGHAAGLVHPGLSLDHVLVTLAMFDGALAAGRADGNRDVRPLALELAIRAVRSPARLDEPIPERRIPFPTPES